MGGDGGGGGGGGGGVDLISSLSDDLLVRILELVPDARDVVRTDALSRRWRGLWTRVAALGFDSDSDCWWPAAVSMEAGAAEQYLAFVDDVLTLRAKATTTTRCCGVKDLKISLNISGHETKELVPPSFKAARGWIRYAVQHEVKSLVLLLYLSWSRPYVEPLTEGEDYGDDHDGDENVEDEDGAYDYDDDDENVLEDDDGDYYDYDDDEKVEDSVPVMALDDLARSEKLETMHLRLAGAKLCLLSSPSTVVFSSLTDVSLEDIVVSGHLLSRLLSPPCCPRLRKLKLTDLHLSTMEELLLEGDSILKISLKMIRNMQSLELRTPSLQVLHVENHFDLERFTVSAPRLEDLMFEAHQPLQIVDVHGHLSSVGTLKIHLYSHGNRDSEEYNDTSIHLLQCCRLTKCLEVSLQVVETIFQTSDIIKGRIPSLPHVTSLKVRVTGWEPHSFGASIASFLAQCNNIRYLSVKIISSTIIKKNHYLCDNSCEWKSHEFSLVHLQEVKFKWLIGTDCELQLIQSILKRQTGVQKVAISFDPSYRVKDNKDAFNLMPPLDGGSWTTCNNADLYHTSGGDIVYELRSKST